MIAHPWKRLTSFYEQLAYPPTLTQIVMVIVIVIHIVIHIVIVIAR